MALQFSTFIRCKLSTWMHTQCLFLKLKCSWLFEALLPAPPPPPPAPRWLWGTRARSHSIVKEQVQASFLLLSFFFLSTLFSFLFSLLSLFSSSLFSLPLSLHLHVYSNSSLPHTNTTDSVVFARLNEDSSPMKKVTLGHLAVSTLPRSIVTKYLHLVLQCTHVGRKLHSEQPS